MSTLREPIAKRIATLYRLLSSEHEGEVLGAVRAMKRLFQSEGLSFHDIATVIESCNGEIEERKYSDSDAEIIFARGVDKGREQEARKREQILLSNYYDANNQPRWNAIALFCQNNRQHLRANEQEFVDDMAGKTMWREPTERQARWLLSIFVRLGGRRQQ